MKTLRLLLATCTLLMTAPLFADDAKLYAIPLKDIDGKDTTLKTFAGKPLLIVNVASQCGYTKQYTGLEAVWRKYKDQGLVVLGVDAQDFRQDARRFMKRFGVTYPVVYDGKGSTLGRWGVTGFPETFFVDREGNVVGERIAGAVDVERNREAFERGLALALGQDR